VAGQVYTVGIYRGSCIFIF